MLNAVPREMKMSLKLKLLVALWLVLNGVDIYLTFVILQMGGYELNPLLSWLLSRVSPEAFLAVRVSAPILLAGLILWLKMFWVAVFLALLLGFAVGWNLLHIWGGI